MGRDRKTAAQLELTGNTARDARQEKQYIAAEQVSHLEPPKSLDEVGRKEWHNITKCLRALGLLSKVDATSVELYCRCYSRYKEYESQPHIVEDQRGNPIKSPAYAMMNNELNQLRRWLNEFGMTPAARQRMVVVEQVEEDKDNKLGKYL